LTPRVVTGAEIWEEADCSRRSNEDDDDPLSDDESDHHHDTVECNVSAQGTDKIPIQLKINLEEKVQLH